MEESLIAVQVCYALPERQEIVSLRLGEGCSVQEAVSASGVLEKFPDIDLSRNKVGVYGKLVKLDAPLRDGDRVEIYRSLIADPKEMRRRRVEETRLKAAEGADSPAA